MKQMYALWLLVICCISVLPAQSDETLEEEIEADEPHVPDLFGFQDYDTRILKINVLDVMQFTTPEGLVGRVQFAYEQKLKPAWSINTELSVNYFVAYKQAGVSKLKLGNGLLTLQVEPRYYLGMNRRMFFKQSKNNFSANYVSLALSTRLLELNRGFSATDNARYLYSDNFGVAPLFGIQRRILKWIFLDFNIGMRLSFGDPVRTRLFFPKDNRSKVWQVLPHTTLRLGFAI